MKPEFSICILTYNRSKLLNRALKSCIFFLNSSTEIVVIDNASTDNTHKLMKKWIKKYPSIKYVRKKSNVGFYNNFKSSFKYCSGKYILYCGDDDLFVNSNTLSYYKKAFTKNNVGLVRSRQVNIKGDMVIQSSQTPNDGDIILNKKGLTQLNPFIFDSFSLTGLAFINDQVLTSLLSDSETMYPQVEICLKLSLRYKSAQIEKILVAVQGHENQLNVLRYSLNEKVTNILDDFSEIYNRTYKYAHKNIFSKSVFLSHICSFLPYFFPYGCLKNGKIDTFQLIYKTGRLNPKILFSLLFYLSISLCLLPKSLLKTVLKQLNIIRLKSDANFKEFQRINLIIKSIAT